jgi:hypothetical protein
MKNVTTQTTIKHLCGHSSQVEVDNSSRTWLKHYAGTPCFVCAPYAVVERLCGHNEQVSRYFTSPRRLETASMQLCTKCQG